MGNHREPRDADLKTDRRSVHEAYSDIIRKVKADVLAFRSGKTDRRPETRTERPGAIPDQTSEIVHLKVDPKSELTRTEPYPTRNFLQSCLSLHSKCIGSKSIDPKSTQTEVHPTQIRSAQNAT